MNDKSNSLKQALAGQNQQGQHPDSDLLTGFVEGSLGQRERETVFVHLASCAHCREVVNVSAAAAPDEFVEKQVVAPVVPRRALGVRLAWLASAAAIAVVATVVLIHESGKQKASESARNANPAQQTAQVNTEVAPAPNSANDRMEPKAEPTPETPPPAPAIEPRQLKAKSAARSQSPQAAQAPVAKNENFPLQAPRPIFQAPAEPRQELARANTNENVVVEATTSAKNSNGVAGGAVGGAIGGPISATAPAADIAAKRSVYTARAVPSNASQPAMAPAAAFDGAAAPMKKVVGASVSHWRIDNNGQLQRSTEQGNWQTLLGLERVRFRAISVSGSDVWAGGEQLRLYHSPDNGATWTRTELPTKGDPQQSITRIHFDSPQIGRVESDGGAIWMTTDGGSTWK
ncbi:MAG TPA: YCF48-related protein [Candidatus Acidoferrales bacterium]|nr:YCF48-related protein [Candidatus Acidoferrales bacterium]